VWSEARIFSARRRPSRVPLVFVGGAGLLGALPRDEHFLVGLVAVDRDSEPDPLLVGEVLGAGAQDRRDAVERVALAATMTQGGLLDAAAYLVDDGGAEFDYVERVEDGGGVGELFVDGRLVAAERVQRRDTDTGTEVVAALREPVGVGLLRPAGHEVEQSGTDLSVEPVKLL